MDVRAALLCAGSLFLGWTSANTDATTPALGGFSMGDERSTVLARLGMQSDQLHCIHRADGLQHCTLVGMEQRTAQRLAIEGVSFTNWSFTFDDARLVAMTASAPVAGDDEIVMLVRLAKTLGRPQIQQRLTSDQASTEASWRLRDNVTLTYHEFVFDRAPLNQRAAVQMLRIADDARGTLRFDPGHK